MPYPVKTYRPRYTTMAKVGYGAAAAYQHRAALGTAWKIGKSLSRSAQRYMSQPRQQKNTAPSVPLKGKRARPRKRKVFRTKNKKDMYSCKSAIRSLQQSERASLGTLTYRNLKSGSSLAVANSNDTKEVADILQAATLESITSQCKYFDPSNPGTLITGSQALGTYQRNTLFKSITSKLMCRNNYQTDARLRVYLCHCKDDTDKSPLTCWTEAVPDGSDLTTPNELTQYPSDYNLVTDLWRLKLVVNTTLAPGQSISVSNTEKDIEIDSATIDSHALKYQREYKAFCWLIVSGGTLAHDTVVSEQGYAPSGIDYTHQNTYVIKYNAGININYAVISNQLDNFTTAPVQSHQPIPDNIGFSVA